MTAASLTISMIFSTIGMGYFIYGKKQQKFFPMVTGVLLGVYPYFLSDILLMLVIGLALTAIPYLMRD